MSRKSAVLCLAGVAVLGLGLTAPAMAASKGAAKGNGSKPTAAASTATCNDGTVTASPAILWPPNHKLNPITITYGESDGDGDSLAITGVTESMVDGSGAANVEGHGAGQPAAQQGPDYVGPTSFTGGTDGGAPASTTVQVRSERAGTVGNGSGRVYSLTVTCKDSGATTPDKNDPMETSSQTGMATVFVCVPHDHSDASLAFCQSHI